MRSERVVDLGRDDLDLGRAVAADDLDDAVDVADLGLALGDAGLEQLLDARQAGGDVQRRRRRRCGTSASVSCVPGSPIDWAAMMPTASPDADHLAGGEVAAVARPADAVARLAGER
jgi:hypothetical protein